MVIMFEEAVQRWRAGAGTLRRIVRQEVVARQLAAHLRDERPLDILDVGCGDGTQALRLARRGHRVTALDSSLAMLTDVARAVTAQPPEVQARLQIAHGDARDLTENLPPECFHVVLCHGLLSYFADPGPVLDDLTRLLVPRGLMSLVVRNGDGLAMRPGFGGDWLAARRAFDDMTCREEFGPRVRADRIVELDRMLTDRGLVARMHYGVRVFTDHLPDDAAVPEGYALEHLLKCEEIAGFTDPYRMVAGLAHVLAERA